MSLVINALWGGHTDRHTDTHMHTDTRPKAISRNQACAAEGHACLVYQDEKIKKLGFKKVQYFTQL